MAVNKGSCLSCIVPLVFLFNTQSYAECITLEPVPKSERQPIQLSPASTGKADNRTAYSRKLDLDGDGVKEIITVTSTNKDDATKTVVTVKTGKTGKLAIPGSIVVSGAAYQFVYLTAIPSQLLKPEYTRFKKEIERTLFKKICTSLDGSATRYLYPGQKLVWSHGKPVMPTTYTVVIYRNQAKALFKKYRITSQAAWLSYRGDNHRRMKNGRLGLKSFIVFAENDAYRVYGTAHGVVIYDKAKKMHAWKYVYSGYEKLIWPSVSGAKLGRATTVQVELRNMGGY